MGLDLIGNMGSGRSIYFRAVPIPKEAFSVNRARMKAAISLAVVVLSSVAAWGQFNYQTLDYPGATETFAVGINRSGAMVGGYIDAANMTHGFSYASGTFQTFDYPGGTFTEANAINSSGSIVGSYSDSAGGNHGFLYQNSTFSSVDFPGAIATYANAINDSGEVAGSYTDSSSANHGFLFLPQNGHYTRFNEPTYIETLIQGINNHQDLSGQVAYKRSPIYGYYLTHAGTFTRFSVPNSAETFAQGINNSGQVVGVWADKNVISPGDHGFLRLPDGTFTTFDVPEGVGGTHAYGINDGGVIIGTFYDLSGKGHGFIATAK